MVDVCRDTLGMLMIEIHGRYEWWYLTGEGGGMCRRWCDALDRFGKELEFLMNVAMNKWNIELNELLKNNEDFNLKMI